MKKTLIGAVALLGAAAFGILIHTSPQARADDKPTVVRMSDKQFAPKEITIGTGDSVVWENMDSVNHTATADDNTFDTGIVAPGKTSKAITFDKPGMYAYYCQFHGGPGGVGMAGLITVIAMQAAGAGATAAPTQPPAPIGLATFADKAKTAHADSITLSFTNLPLAGEDKQYEAWLASQTTTLSLGKITLKPDGTATLSFADPKGANLIDKFNAVLVTLQGTTLTPPGPIVYSGTIPPQSYVHVQHILSRFPDTPDHVGLLIGALDEEAELTDHITFLAQAVKAGNLVNAKLHLEHIYNILSGKADAKDLNGNGKIEVLPPGDGFGLFNYLTGAVEHAGLAAQQNDATDTIKIEASHVRITAANASATLTQIQTLVVQAVALKTTTDMKPLVDQMLSLNDTVLKGVPDSTGLISPIKGSGGLLLAYNSALAMAAIPIAPSDITGGQPVVTPAATTSAAAIATPATTAPAANVQTITLTDFDFAPKTVTIKAGTSVVFVNQGQRKHTATADDNSFDTGVIAPGASSAPVVFNKPGTVPYYCQFHGGPGGVGMAAVIVVQ
jgi:plastocyanin